MVDFAQNRQLRRFVEANQSIDKKQIADKPNKGGYYIIGPNPVLGGYDIKSDIGNVYYGVKCDTNQALGIGDEVSFYPGGRTIRVDARPALSNPVGSSVSDLASTLTNPTKPTTGGIGGIGGGVAGGGRYRRGTDGSCTLVWGGPTLPNDYSTLEECTAGDPEGYKIWACEVGSNGTATCKQVASGLGKYNKKSDCDAKIVVPTYTGGQCQGVLYDVSLLFDVPGLGFTGVTGLQSNVLGPVSGVKGSPDVAQGYEITGFGGQTFGGNPYGQALTNIQITSVTRVDGQPDTCGNPPQSCGV